MLDFQPLALDHAPAIRRAAAAGRAATTEQCFTTMWLWRREEDTAAAITAEGVFLHCAAVRLRGYYFPLGTPDDALAAPVPAVDAALAQVLDDAAARGRPADFLFLTAAQRDYLQRFCPGGWVFSSDRGDADYLYSREELADPPWHRKRNHIAQFVRQYPDWRFAPLTPDNAADALAIASAWHDGNENKTELAREYAMIAEALGHCAELKLRGGIIYLDGRPAAMAVASPVSRETADVHFEKTVPDCRGAYALINRETARALAGFRWLNRENDMNIDGLRQAKMSYHPARIAEKFTARANP